MSFDLDSFVAGCRAALREHSPALAVKELLDRALVDAHAIDDALGPATEGGTRALHRADDLTVLQVVWPPHVKLFPHDHRMWAVNGIYGGTEENTFYRRTPGGIVQSGGKDVHAGDVIVLGNEAIHSVVNPRRSYTAAIHVYGGDFFGVPRSEWDAESMTERPFDVEHVREVLAEADARHRSS